MTGKQMMKHYNYPLREDSVSNSEPTNLKIPSWILRQSFRKAINDECVEWDRHPGLVQLE
jgi:hypothetical protein